MRQCKRSGMNLSVCPRFLTIWQTTCGATRAGIDRAGMSPISDKSSHAPGIEPESFSTQKGEHESTLQIIIQTCPTNTSACWRPGPDACSVLHTSLAELSLTSPSAPHSLSHSVPGQRGPPHPHIVDKLFLRIAPQRSLHASDLHTFLCSQSTKPGVYEQEMRDIPVNPHTSHSHLLHTNEHDQ
ncbi:unnamed protein product [Leuciscus chuanchicus]